MERVSSEKQITWRKEVQYKDQVLHTKFKKLIVNINGRQIENSKRLLWLSSKIHQWSKTATMKKIKSYNNIIQVFGSLDDNWASVWTIKFPPQKWGAVMLFLGTNHHPWLFSPTCAGWQILHWRLKWRNSRHFPTEQKQNSSHPREQKVSVCEGKHTCGGSQHTWTEGATLEAQTPQITAVCTHRTGQLHTPALARPTPACRAPTHLAELSHIWLSSHLQGSHTSSWNLTSHTSSHPAPRIYTLARSLWPPLADRGTWRETLTAPPDGTTAQKDQPRLPSFSMFPLSNISR